MASPRTRKRKQQRLALKARRMCPRRPPRALAPMERVMQAMYADVARQMFAGDTALLDRCLDGFRDVVGKPYTYTLRTK